MFAEQEVRFDYQAFWDEVFVGNYATPEIYIVSGHGCTVTDVNGKRYLDFTAGLAVASTGHAHPRVAEAVAKQASRLLHVSNLYGNMPQLRLAHRLVEATGLDKVFLCNSGTEANEFAIKAARKAAVAKGVTSGRVIAFTDGFHGRTLGALAATGQPKYHEGFGPLPQGFEFLPFNDVAALEKALETPAAAVIVEPIQGEAGVHPATKGFLVAARKLTTAAGAALLLDEVQTGVGRTGRFLAAEHAGIRPDAVSLAKGLASGVPIGAVVLDKALAGAIKAGDHGCTFGGNPISSAAALATLDVIEDEHLVENAARMGTLLQESLRKALGAKAREVRGVGLMVGVELAAPAAPAVKKAALDQGLLVNSIGDNVLRLVPPLVVTADEVQRGVGILKSVA